MRIESPRALRNGGWFHAFETAPPWPPVPHPPARRSAPPPPPDFGVMMQRYWKENHPVLAAEAERMGLPLRALEWLGAAYAGDRRAVAFPMYDATGPNRNHVVGIRLRTGEGRKFAVTGSASGIFYPWGAIHVLSPFERLYICEGPTDTAAALDLGCFAVGRASCRGGEKIIRSVVEQLWPDEVVVVTDNDGPGVEGARELLRHLPRPKKLLTLPAKDLRAFRAHGGTRMLLEELLKNVVPK
jgi:hypothetical protein